VLLAALATLLWWNSSPGLFNAVCLNVMLVCSVSTLLLNGNPLLRYDGYYILSDLVNMPNLRQRSVDWWKRILKSLCLGIEPLPEELPSSRRHAFLLGLYGLLATVFRMFVIGMILWFVYRFLRARELTVFFFPLLLIVIGGTFGPPIKRAVQLLLDPLWRSGMKPFRIAGTLLVLLSVSLFFCCVPLPAYVYCPVLIEPFDAQHIYAYQPGRLQEAVAENSGIETGDLIFRLENESLDFELEELAGRLAQQEIRVQNLEARSSTSREVENELPLARQLLRDLQQQHRQMSDRKSQLHGYSPIDGVVFPPPATHTPPGSDLELESYSGTPFDPVNAGCWIEAGTHLCTIGDPGKMQATLLANEQQLKLIRRGQHVSVLPASASMGIIEGRVEAIGKTRREMAPEQFLPDDRIVVVPRADGTKALVDPLWEIRVRWPGSPQFLEPGLRGTARIRVDSMTLLTRFLRWVYATFQT
jgi:putative peptide zinc metalloprotease protein